VQSARYAGFSGLKNGELLDAAEADGFQVLLTVDQGFGHQQNLTGRNIALVIFRTKSIALEKLLPQVPACLAVLQTIKPGESQKYLLVRISSRRISSRAWLRPRRR
jgi:hypothetical protein